MVDEASDKLPLWRTVTALMGVALGAPFDRSLIEKFSMQRDFESEEELDFEAELWDGSVDSDLIIINVFDGEVVGVWTDSVAHAGSHQIIGMSMADLVSALGDPTEDSCIEGSGYYSYLDGYFELDVYFEDEIVTSAGISNYSYIDKSPVSAKLT